MFKNCRDHLLIEVNGESQLEHLMAYVLFTRQLCVYLKRYVMKRILNLRNLCITSGCCVHVHGTESAELFWNGRGGQGKGEKQECRETKLFDTR